MSYIKVDTREKDNSYILEDFSALGVEFSKEKLEEGDYESSDNPDFVIDLKNGIDEVQTNIAGNEAQRARFLNEIVRCQLKHKKLVILIREEKIYSIAGVQYWKSPKTWRRNKKTGKFELKPRTNVSGKFIMKVMERYRDEFGIDWFFCKPKDSAKTIINLLRRNGSKI